MSGGLSSAVSFRNDIFAFAAKVELGANETAALAAEACAEYARQGVPVGSVDTLHGSRPGALRDSIQVEGEAAGVGDRDAFYAGWVNKGTVFMSPRPFWKRATNKAKRDFYVKCSRINAGRWSG